MPSAPHGDQRSSSPVSRELGGWDHGRPGPTVLVMAGVHGNEPAGLTAVQRVLDHLREHEVPIAGRLCAFAGNLGALAKGVRFQARDLNRGWGEAAIAALRQRAAAAASAHPSVPLSPEPLSPESQSPGPLSPEDGEQLDLLDRFEQVLRTASGPVVFVDLHSSSAPGAPFLCLADTIDNRRVGLATGVPIILGIEETIDGAALEWFAHRGVVGLAAEGGQHQHPDTVGNHEAMLWLLLERVGLLRRGQVDLSPHRAHLARSTAGVPGIVEIVHRHAIVPADRFVMAPGFTNFAPAAKGTLLAHDARGEVRAPYACRVLLPLYQALGDDGYFLARPVRTFWLHLARWLRACRLHVVLPLLPGVRRDPDDRDTLLADRRVARWFTTEIFHLLGYRRERVRGDRLAFSRRRSRPENARL